MTTSKKTGIKPAKKKTTKKAAKKAAPSLGREGSLGHFFRHAILNTKKSKADVLRDARKKFPDSDIPNTYYQWYTNDCKKKGLLAK